MLDVPESVLCYCTQPAIATAINLLLARKRPNVPEALQWAEVPSYYRAILSARQTQVEYAMLLARAWSSVWPEARTGWTLRAPASSKRSDLAIDVENVWDQSCFGRRFERGGTALELYVGLETAQAGVRAGFWMGDAKEATIYPEGLEQAGWEFSDEYGSYWTPEALVPLRAEVDLTPLLRFADTVLAL